MKTIGVLALQGAFIEHVDYLNQCIQKHDHNAEVVVVKTPEELIKCDSLVIPGGESTSMSLIAQRTGLFPHLHEFVHNPTKSIWGTCAGLIFLSQQLGNEAELVKTLDLLSVRVQRNAFGRQAQSFTKPCDFSGFIPECADFPTVFIRAPVIQQILDKEKVEVLYSLQNKDQELIVAVRQGNILATSFHPELADDIRFHDWFIREFVI